MLYGLFDAKNAAAIEMNRRLGYVDIDSHPLHDLNDLHDLHDIQYKLSRLND